MSPGSPQSAKRILFFGSPPIALPSLEALLESGHEVIGVVTGPDRPAGRGMDLRPSAVKSAATSRNLPVLQPPTLRTSEAQSALAAMAADVYVVVAYGLILPAEVLDLPALGCVNVHFSLLPRHRGAAPVQWAILEGDEVTGVSIMNMDVGLDTGPVLKTVELAIGENETAGELEERLSSVGAKALVEVIDSLETIEPQPQPDEGATYAAKLSGADARIDWALPAQSIRNLVHGLNPRPGAWTTLGARRVKILRVGVSDAELAGAPGALEISRSGVRVITGTAALELIELQPQGKPRMRAVDFARGIKTPDPRFE